MAQEDFGGNNGLAGFTDVYVTSPISLPSGRLCADGHAWALVLGLRGYANGRSATRTITLSIDGLGSTSGFARAAASSGGDTGFVSCSFYCEGGSGTFRISSSGSFYFARGGSGTTTDNNGLHRTDGALGGSILYVYAPTAPSTPSLSSPVPGELDIVWTAPSDNGGSGITGYRVQIADNSAFTVGVTTYDLGNVLSLNATGLTPGKTYYVRVFAKNAVTTGHGTFSVASGSSSLAVLASAHKWDGLAEQIASALVRWDGTKEVPITTAVRWNGTAEVPLT